MNPSNASLAALHDIRRMMQRSNRFLSLSGFCGIAAGLWALVGAFFAYDWIFTYEEGVRQHGPSAVALQHLKWNLFLLAGAILGVALLSVFYFTWRRASSTQTPLWDRPARLLLGSIIVPLATGGLLIAILLLQNGTWQLVVPLSLVFYGLALVSGSRYTLSDIRYLGLCEVALGLVSSGFGAYGLYFWAFGFGVLHIVYGAIMWWKYERRGEQASLAY